MIQGILFDFDGTLADTSPVIFDCYAYATEKVLGHKAPLQPYLNARTRSTTGSSGPSRA